MLLTEQENMEACHKVNICHNVFSWLKLMTCGLRKSTTFISNVKCRILKMLKSCCYWPNNQFCKQRKLF